MSDRLALIRAMIDRPKDETLRLVFADWLDDHGEDGAALRRPGYQTFQSPGVVGPPYQSWWAARGALIYLGELPPSEVPRCVSIGCGLGRAAGFYFEAWRCLQCAARFATVHRIGIWEWVNGKRPEVKT